MPRAIIYIDWPNQGHRGWDLVKLVDTIGAEVSIVETVLYEEEPGIALSRITGYQDELPRCGFRRVLLPALRKPKRELVDVQLSVDMVSDAYENKMDTAILVAGDADYLPAVRKLLALGKQIKAAAFGRPSGELRSLIEILPLESILPSIKY